MAEKHELYFYYWNDERRCGCLAKGCRWNAAAPGRGTKRFEIEFEKAHAHIVE